MGSHADANSQTGALEVSGSSCQLQDVASQSIPVDEGADDWSLVLAECLTEVGGCECPPLSGVDVVDAKVPQLNLGVGTGPEVESNANPE